MGHSGAIVAVQWYGEYQTFCFLFRSDRDGRIRPCAPGVDGDKYFLGFEQGWFKVGELEINGVTRVQIALAALKAKLPTCDEYVDSGALPGLPPR